MSRVSVHSGESTPEVLRVDIPPNEWLTDNARLHWAAKSRRVRALRLRASYLAHDWDTSPRSGRVRIIATIITRTRTRFDPTNADAAVKPILDGIVDAGILPDDDSTHLIGPDFRRGEPDPHLPRGWHRVEIRIEEE